MQSPLDLSNNNAIIYGNGPQQRSVGGELLGGILGALIGRWLYKRHEAKKQDTYEEWQDELQRRACWPRDGKISPDKQGS